MIDILKSMKNLSEFDVLLRRWSSLLKIREKGGGPRVQSLFNPAWEFQDTFYIMHSKPTIGEQYFAGA